MNTAKFFQTLLDIIETDGEGFRQFEQWEFVVNAARRAASEIEELCPDSYDSAIVLKFKNGSELLINNPRQAAFAGDSRVIA